MKQTESKRREPVPINEAVHFLEPFLLPGARKPATRIHCGRALDFDWRQRTSAKYREVTCPRCRARICARLKALHARIATDLKARIRALRVREVEREAVA